MNREEAKRIRDELRKQIQTPGYEKRERERIQSAIHDQANQIVNNEVKSAWQIAFLEAIPPLTHSFTNRRTGKQQVRYFREETIQRMINLIEAVLEDPLPGEYAELSGLKKFVKNSAELRQKRNKSMMFRYDPRKSGHDVARQFAIDRFNVFEYYFPNKRPLFLN